MEIGDGGGLGEFYALVGVIFENYQAARYSPSRPIGPRVVLASGIYNLFAGPTNKLKTFPFFRSPRHDDFRMCVRVFSIFRY